MRRAGANVDAVMWRRCSTFSSKFPNKKCQEVLVAWNSRRLDGCDAVVEILEKLLTAPHEILNTQVWWIQILGNFFILAYNLHPLVGTLMMLNFALLVRLLLLQLFSELFGLLDSEGVFVLTKVSFEHENAESVRLSLSACHFFLLWTFLYWFA